MSSAPHDQLNPAPARAFRLHALARRARTEQISGPALLAASVALCVATGALLVWAGIVTGPIRALLLLMAAGLMRLRLIPARLEAVTPADGLDGAPIRRSTRCWSELGQVAAILIAAGLCAYGSGSGLGPALGGLCAVLALIGGRLGRDRPGIRCFAPPHPTSLLAAFCLIAVLEPLWGWRGQSLVIGLCLIAGVLAWRILRLSPSGGA